MSSAPYYPPSKTVVLRRGGKCTNFSEVQPSPHQIVTLVHQPTLNSGYSAPYTTYLNNLAGTLRTFFPFCKVALDWYRNFRSWRHSAKIKSMLHCNIDVMLLSSLSLLFDQIMSIIASSVLSWKQYQQCCKMATDGVTRIIHPRWKSALFSGLLSKPFE